MTKALTTNTAQLAFTRIAASLGHAFTDFLDPVRLNDVADDLRLISKVCVHDLGLVATSLVLSSFSRSSDSGGRFADARLLYQQLGGPITPEASFRQRAKDCGDLLFFLFTQRLRFLAKRAAPDLRGRLSRFVDLFVTDGSVYKLAASLSDFLPGTKTKAAFKLHAIYSVKQQAPLSLEFTSGRVHDNSYFPSDVWVKDALYLWDLGYDDHHRVVNAIIAGSHFIQPLKSNANPVVLSYYDKEGKKHTLKGKKGGKRHLAEVCELEEALQQMNEMDFDVELVGEKGKTAIARVVCVPVNGKDLYYLTSLPREQFTPFDVAEIYAVRWEVELFFKHLKGGVRLDEVRRLSNLHSLRAITYSSLLASLLSHEIIIAASLQLEPEIADTPPEIKQAIDEKEQKEPPPAAFSP